MSQPFNRRRFMAATAAAGIGAAAIQGKSAPAADPAALGKPAILGGQKARKKPFSSWPLVKENDEEAMAATGGSAKWFRGDKRRAREKLRGRLRPVDGSKTCIATNSGTSALVASLGALGLGPGDE